jgi:hypothetical protein
LGGYNSAVFGLDMSTPIEVTKIISNMTVTPDTI